jgi:hypothetical protein
MTNTIRWATRGAVGAAALSLLAVVGAERFLVQPNPPPPR